MDTQYDISKTVIPFSWKRMLMAGRFYWPDLKRQILWYPIITVALSLLMFLLPGNKMAAIMLSTFGTAIQAMFIFAPTAIATRDQRITASILPVSARERFTFLTLYFLVAVPAVVFGLQALTGYICHFINPDAALTQLQHQATSIAGDIGSHWYSSFKTWVAGALCLWGVLYYRENRILKSVLTTIALGVMYTITFTIASITYALNKMPQPSERLSTTDSEQLARQMTSDILVLDNYVSAISAVLLIILLVMSYRAIRNYQA